VDIFFLNADVSNLKFNQLLKSFILRKIVFILGSIPYKKKKTCQVSIPYHKKMY